MQDRLFRPKSTPQVLETSSDSFLPNTEPSEGVAVPASDENRQRSVDQFSAESLQNCPAGDPATLEMQARANRISTLLANAETLYRHQEKIAARTLVYKALAENPTHPMALKMAARFLHPLRDLDQLIQIQKIIVKSDYGFESVARLADLYYKKGLDLSALEKYHESLGLILNETEVLFDVFKNMGNILTKEKDFEGAEEFYHKAYTLKPDSDILLVNLGTLAMQQQDLDLALGRFRGALELNNKNEKAWVGLGLVHQSMGDFSLALGNIQSALDINPANRTAVHVFVAWAVKDGKIHLAIERLQDYLSQVDVDEEMSIVLIQLFCQLHRLELAQIEIERVMLWNPENQQLQAVEQEVREMLTQVQHRTAKELVT